MSKVAPRPTLLRRPQFPSDLRRLFRELARVAVASSFSVAAVACTRYQLEDDPKLEEEPGGQSGQGGGGAGGAGGQGGIGGVGGISGIGGAGGFAGDAGAGGFAGDAGAGGFGGSGGGPGDPPWVAIPCNPSTFTPNLIDPSTLQRPIDFAAAYRVWFNQWSDWDSGLPVESTEVIEQVLFGEACGLATDWSTCNKALNALKPTPDSCLDGDACRAILTTEGDALMRIEERSALRALLGPIDSAKEAALAAWLSGTDVACVQEFTDPPLGTRTRQTPNGIEVETRVDDCGNNSWVRRERVREDGSVEFISQTDVPPTCSAGRRPAGLQDLGGLAPCDELGAYFASAAHLEAASVHAFARFARELHALGAPEALVADAWRAALEELAHTRMVGMIAARFGGEVPMPSIAEPAARDAFAIALENAVEGCVRESYGALVAWYQAEAATDPMVKSAMAQIAEDETRHAELSWRVAEWLEPQLTQSQRACIATARREAFTSLQGELAKQGLSEAAATRIGLPDPDRSLALLNQMSTALAMPLHA